MKEYSLWAQTEGAVDVTFSFTREFLANGEPYGTHMWVRYADKPSESITLVRPRIREFALRDIRARFSHPHSG